MPNANPLPDLNNLLHIHEYIVYRYKHIVTSLQIDNLQMNTCINILLKQFNKK